MMVIYGESAGDSIGYGQSVVLSSDGRRLAVGSSKAGAGMVRVYQWIVRNSFWGSAWMQLGDDILGEAGGGVFPAQSGYACSMNDDGSIVAIGAPYNSGAGNFAGHARVLTYKAPSPGNDPTGWDPEQITGGDWIQLGSDVDPASAGQLFGSAVSLDGSGKRLAVCAPYNNDAGAGAGTVKVFDYSSATGWVQIGQDVDGVQPGDYSGRALSLSKDGSRLVIKSNGAGPNSDPRTTGRARAFELVGSTFGSTWIRIGNSFDDEYSGTGGAAVAVNADGTKVVVGADAAVEAASPDGAAPGRVRVYDLTTTC
mmetsp:Transcript_15894/g.49232  ORF Transcript_15894/g.49232 Transcript_15894/m.49232 type:complete len:311 (+) Transcript_15894:219-1151(+)